MQEEQGVLRFTSTDVSRVAETWSRFAPSSQLLGIDPVRCGLDWSSVVLGDLSVIRYRLDADVRSAIEPEDQLFTCRVASEDGVTESGGQTLPGSRTWATDARRVTSRWRGSATVHALVFERDAAERLARQMCGDDSLILRVASPAAESRAAALQWDRTFSYLADSLSGADGIGSPLLEAGLRRHALWTILATFRTTFSDALERSPQTREAPKTVRRALSYIDAHAHEAITIDDVSRAVHISTRGLQHAFRRSLGFTPFAYVRRVRLSHARAELATLLPSESWATVAARWGYASPARFAEAYAAEFGEHPADTAPSG